MYSPDLDLLDVSNNGVYVQARTWIYWIYWPLIIGYSPAIDLLDLLTTAGRYSQHLHLSTTDHIYSPHLDELDVSTTDCMYSPHLDLLKCIDHW